MARALLPDDDDHALDQAVAALARSYYAIAERSPEGLARSLQEALARFTALGNQSGQARMELASGDFALWLGDREVSAALRRRGRPRRPDG